MHAQAWRNAALRGLAIVAPPLVVFAFPTIALVGRNLDYFPQGYHTGLPLYLAALCWLAVGVLLAVVDRGKVKRFLFALYLLSAPAWFLHALALEVSSSVLVSLFAVGAWLIGAVVATRVPLPTLYGYAALVAAALLVGGGAPAVVAATGTATQSEAGDQYTDLRTDPDLPNIYHIIFDEYQTDFFEHLLDDGLQRDLRGFTFYPDTTVTYGRTPMSLASMFASQDYEYDLPPEAQIERAFHAPDSTLQILGASGYHRRGWLHRTRALGEPPALDDWVLQDDLVAQRQLPGYSELLVSMWLYANAPEDLVRELIPTHHYDQLTADAFLPDDAPPGSVIAFRELIRQEAALPARGRYTFAHLILPHFPNVLDSDCTYVAGETTGPLEQAACANLLMREFVAKLRELDRLEDSIVILHSDHGSWYRVMDGIVDRPRGQGYDSEQASTARSRGVLLVHLPSTVSGAADALRVDERPTVVEDIMPTIFRELDLEHEFSGNRVPVHEDVPGDRMRHYHWYERGDEGVLTDGLLKRFIIDDGQAVYDRDVPVPAPD